MPPSVVERELHESNAKDVGAFRKRHVVARDGRDGHVRRVPELPGLVTITQEGPRKLLEQRHRGRVSAGATHRAHASAEAWRGCRDFPTKTPPPRKFQIGKDFTDLSSTHDDAHYRRYSLKNPKAAFPSRRLAPSSIRPSRAGRAGLGTACRLH